MRLALAVATDQLHITVDDAVLSDRRSILNVFKFNLAQAFIGLVANRCRTGTRFL